MLLAFRAKEAERKMREAALKHDYEGAITLRDEWRSLTAELVELERQAVAQEVDRKVIDLKTKQPVATDEAEPDRSDYKVIDLVTEDAHEPEPEEAFTPNSEETSLLGYITEEVTAGRLTGLIIFAGHREAEGEISVVSSWSTTPAWDEMQKFLGAFAECQHDLLAVSGDMFDEDEDAPHEQ